MSTPRPPRSGLLFTAFEPSGDAVAAALIAELKRRDPSLPIHALGGPLMRDAGAELLEITTEHAAMLTSAVGQAMEHRRRLSRLKQWMRYNPLLALVPVDSPAANWSVCALTRKMHNDAHIIHLVAPQLWAWAPWRIHKLQRLTDHVLCLLPFEPKWFGDRGVPGTFVGHPVFEAPAPSLAGLPVHEGLKLTVMPGSREGELRKNWPTMAAVISQLQKRHPSLMTVVALRDAKAVETIDRVSADLSERPDTSRLRIVTGQTDAALVWSDAVLVKSGTSTLQVVARQKPMVAMFNANRVMWNVVGRFVVRTRTFTLPNLMGESLGLGRVVPEFVPHFGKVAPVFNAIDALLTDTAKQQAQRDAMARIAQEFANVPFAKRAADVLLNTLRS